MNHGQGADDDLFRRESSREGHAVFPGFRALMVGIEDGGQGRLQHLAETRRQARVHDPAFMGQIHGLHAVGFGFRAQMLILHGLDLQLMFAGPLAVGDAWVVGQEPHQRGSRQDHRSRAAKENGPLLPHVDERGLQHGHAVGRQLHDEGVVHAAEQA